VQAITVYGSQSEAYHRAFKVFLDHTDQKANARAWLQDLVRSLLSRRVFIDAGAGNGQVTAWFVPSFERTIAIEPNDSLRDELRRACPSAEVIAEPILEAKPSATADLVLCSHVFYYIERAEWMATLDRLASWLAPGGILVLGTPDYGRWIWRFLEGAYKRVFPQGYATEHINQYTRKSLRKEIERMGLVVQDIQYVAASEMIFKAVKPTAA